MSAALVREALELVESSGKKNVKSTKGYGVKDLYRKKKPGKFKQTLLKNKVLSSKQVRCTIEELRTKLHTQEDNTERNLRMLQRFGEINSVDKKAADKIFERTVKNKKEKPTPVGKEESTAFTEEDFAKFEQEYFVS